MQYTLFRPLSQYYRIINNGGFYSFLLLALLIAGLYGMKGNNLRNSRIQNNGYFIQGTQIGTMVVPNTNLKYPIAYFSFYDDFYIRSDATLQYLSIPYYANLLYIDLLNLFFSNDKTVTFLTLNSGHKITRIQDDTVLLNKWFKANNKEEVRYLSNGIKYNSGSLIFDNNGNFFSEKAGLDELDHMNKIIGGHNRLFADRLFFENSKKVYIYDPQSRYTIVFLNNPANRVYINPQYKTVNILTDITMNKNTATSNLEMKVIY